MEYGFDFNQGVPIAPNSSLSYSCVPAKEQESIQAIEEDCEYLKDGEAEKWNKDMLDLTDSDGQTTTVSGFPDYMKECNDSSGTSLQLKLKMIANHQNQFRFKS